MDQSFDLDIYNTLEATFQAALLIHSGLTPEQIKLMIVATSLESLAKSFLLADSEPERISMNLKQVALGILGTADWVKEPISVL